MESIKRPRRLKASKDSSQVKPTLYETNCCNETETTSRQYRDSNMETCLSVTAHTNTEHSNNGTVDSKEKLYGNQQTSFEDNADSINKKTPSPTTPWTSMENENLWNVADRKFGHNRLQRRRYSQFDSMDTTATTIHTIWNHTSWHISWLATNAIKWLNHHPRLQEEDFVLSTKKVRKCIQSE